MPGGGTPPPNSPDRRGLEMGGEGVDGAAEL